MTHAIREVLNAAELVDRRTPETSDGLTFARMRNREIMQTFRTLSSMADNANRFGRGMTPDRFVILRGVHRKGSRPDWSTPTLTLDAYYSTGVDREAWPECFHAVRRPDMTPAAAEAFEAWADAIERYPEDKSGAGEAWNAALARMTEIGDEGGPALDWVGVVLGDARIKAHCFGR